MPDTDVAIAYIFVSIFAACALVSIITINILAHLREERLGRMEQRTWLLDGGSADAGEEEQLPRYSTAAEQGAPPKYLDEPPPGYGDDVVIVMVRG